MEKDGKVEAASHETVRRPWGEFRNHYTIPGAINLKTLHLLPGAILSLQRHSKRSETWMLVQGDASAVCGKALDALEIHELEIDKPFRVPVGTIHRLTSEKGGVIVEIMYGTYEEDDIERFEDVYGRV